MKNCDEAIELYQKAFDATVEAIYRNDRNLIDHAEINIFDQCVAFMEQEPDSIIGNTMQICFYFNKGDEEIIKKHIIFLKTVQKLNCH